MEELIALVAAGSSILKLGLKAFSPNPSLSSSTNFYVLTYFCNITLTEKSNAIVNYL